MDLALTFIRWLLIGCFTAAMVCAAISDLRTLQIPNWVSALVAVMFLPSALLADISLHGIAIHYGTGLLLFVIGALLFARGLFGGGDVKLLAATGVWVGWVNLLPYLLVVSILGGLLALASILLRRIKQLPAFLAPLPWLKPGDGRGQPIPYGVAIATAAMLGLRSLVVLP